jgi:hypothetical protein
VVVGRQVLKLGCGVSPVNHIHSNRMRHKVTYGSIFLDVIPDFWVGLKAKRFQAGSGSPGVIIELVHKPVGTGQMGLRR